MPHSNKLTFAVPQINDFERFYEIYSDPETNLFNPDGAMDLEKAKESFAKMTEGWNKYNFSSWTIKLKEKIIGFGGLSYRQYGDELKLNLGYRFDKEYWGQGFATELAKHAIDYGFEELQKDQIFAIVRPKHIASIKVLEKCNMKLSGKLNDVPNEEDSLIYIIEKNDTP